MNTNNVQQEQTKNDCKIIVKKKTEKCCLNFAEKKNNIKLQTESNRLKLGDEILLFKWKLKCSHKRM